MLPKRLINLRKSKKMTQEEFAKAIGITRSSYSQYELGNREPDYDILDKIAKFYDVTVDYLLGRIDESTGMGVIDSDNNAKKILARPHLHWDDIPLTDEDLKPVLDLLEMVARERRARYLAEKEKTKNQEEE